jgi:glyoxylase-like metal-dependent hydrolase (beta-lactamase superfamily II)
MPTPKLFRGSAEPQMNRLFDNFVLIEQSDPGAAPAHISTNTYAILANGRALLFDVNDSGLLPFVEQLKAEGFAPAGLVLSHRHTAGLGDAVQIIAERFRIPVFLHPLDAQHPQADIGVQYQDPMGHPLLAECGGEALHFPGHTEGSIALYLSAGGGTLLTGDAAMGPSAPQTEAGVERLLRPPISMMVDDNQLRECWLAFVRPVSSVLPYHGTGYVQRAADLPEIMSPLKRQEPTQNLTG